MRKGLALNLFPSNTRVLMSTRLKHRFVSLHFFAPNPKDRKPRQKWDWKHLQELTGGEYTIDPLRVNRLGGRDPETRRKVNQHIGGGVKFDFFMIDYFRCGPEGEGESYDERVLEVRKDPNRSAYLALVCGLRGKRWTLATKGLKAGFIAKTFGFIPEIPIPGEAGHSYKVGALASNTQVCLIDRYPRRGAPVFITKAGEFATIVRQRGDHTLIRMPWGQDFALDNNCYCTVGQISHSDFALKQWGSAQMHRRFGYHVSSGLWHRKTGYFGRRPFQPTAPHEIKEVLQQTLPNKIFTFPKDGESWDVLSGNKGNANVHPLVSKTHFRF